MCDLTPFTQAATARHRRPQRNRRRRRLTAAGLGVAVTFGLTGLTGCAGQLDHGFGVAGIRRLPPATGPLNIRLLTCGKILAATSWLDLAEPIYVFRLNADGSLDASYAKGGVLALSLPAGQFDQTIAISPDGRAYVHTSTLKPGIGRIVAYTAAGKPDPTFGSAGHLSLDATPAISPSGQLYLPTGRYSPAGRLDPSFRYASLVNYEPIVAFGPGGTIYLESYFAGGHGPGPFTVRRLTAHGAVDASFAASGNLTLPQGLSIAAVAVDTAGRLVMTINSPLVTRPGWVFRFTAAGKPDLTFGWLGMAPLPPAQPVGLDALAIDSAGRILTGGSSGTGQQVVYRLLPSGQPDPTFGIGGKSVLAAVQAAPDLDQRGLATLAADTANRPVLAVTVGTTPALTRLTG